MKVRMMPIFIICVLHIISIKAQSPSVELRGVWVATVSNIDWPSKAGLSIKQQKEEIIKILDYYKSKHFNTIFLQIRPCSDVFYKSDLEPWSKYLTGDQGQNPHYDPLKYWIKETHKRDIELHAWINPYRITQSKSDSLVAEHPAIKHPEWVVEYGGKKYFNPGLPEVSTYLVQVVKEIIENYDVDGIHFDDYFYPYPRLNETFADSATYQKYNVQSLSIDDWRRENVNRTIKDLHDIIKNHDQYLQFGVSPFGVWRNQKDDSKGSITNAGITNFDHIYADVLTWMREDWVDYVVPQIYWSTENKAVPFNHLVDWWAQYSCDKNVYVGHAIYKVNSKDGAWRDSTQINQQISKARTTNNVSGSVFFSHNQLVKNELCVSDSINQLFSYPALIPVNKSVKYEFKNRVDQIKHRKHRFKWKCESSKDVKYYVVYGIKRGGAKQLVMFTHKRKLDIENVKALLEDIIGIQISIVDLHNMESIGSEIVYL